MKSKWIAIALCLSGCVQPESGAVVSQSARLAYSTEAAPEGAAPGSCWALDISPAVLETVTEQVIIRHEERDSDGRVIQPAIYSTEARQHIVKPREELRFETPCRADLTAEFIASVQRALAARGIYHGAVTEVLDSHTLQAIRAFQVDHDLDSAVLSLENARRLGLIAVPR